MNVSFPVPSSDTLFDLELLSPVPAPKGPSLGDEIAARATTCTKKASDAIASWAEGERAQSADPRFEGLFVSGYGMDLHRVVNLAVRGDGDLLVRFSSPSKRGGEERVDVLASARWAKDGSLVGSTGTRMIPAALIPDGPVLTDRRVFVGDLHDPLKLVSSRGPWGLFANLWSDQPLGSEHVALLSEMVEIPSSLIADEGAPLPKDLKERLKSLHIASLGKKLAAVNALAPGWDALGAAGNLLQKTWGSEELLPEEENLLAPVLALFTWTFFTGEWDATVEIDSDMGWQSDIRVEATHIPTGARVHGYHDLHEDDADLLDWFNPATRQGKVISLLEKAAQSEASPAPTPMKGNGKAAKVHLASQERLDDLKKDMTVLASVSNTDLQAKALLEASGVLAKAKATEAEVSFAHQGLGEAFAPHGQKVMEEAKALFEVLIWEGEILGKARALAARYDELSGTVQCRDDNSEGVSEMIKHIDSSTRVFEVAPGWWVGKDVDGSLHGAVSCTGFYSGAGRLAEGDETKSLTTHLLEEPGMLAKRYSWVFRSENCTPAFVDWVKSLPYAPELNALRGAVDFIADQGRKLSIRTHLARAVAALEAADFPVEEAHALYRAIDGGTLRGVDEAELAQVARSLLSERFGEPKVQAKAQAPVEAEEEEEEGLGLTEEEEGDGTE